LKTPERIQIIFRVARGFDLREDRVVRDAGLSLGENTRNGPTEKLRIIRTARFTQQCKHGMDAILMKDMLRDAITVENISSRHKFLASADKGHHQTSM